VYLVVVTMDTPGWRVPAGRLREVIIGSASGTDDLQHVYLEIRDDIVVLSLYLRAARCGDAMRNAEHLCRRTMAILGAGRRWRLRSTDAGLE
jgi:hypothetical protein